MSYSVGTTGCSVTVPIHGRGVVNIIYNKALMRPKHKKKHHRCVCKTSFRGARTASDLRRSAPPPRPFLDGLSQKELEGDRSSQPLVGLGSTEACLLAAVARATQQW